MYCLFIYCLLFIISLLRPPYKQNWTDVDTLIKTRHGDHLKGNIVRIIFTERNGKWYRPLNLAT